MKPKISLSLEQACAFLQKHLPSSEYLIERHSIIKGETYTDLSVSAKWLAEYETISVDVKFLVTAAQKKEMQPYLDDENYRDDIDSGIGELFEQALKEQYPKYDWSFPIGEVKIKCAKA